MNRKILINMSLAFMLILLTQTAFATAMSSLNFSNDWNVNDNGGTPAAGSSNFTITSSIGQSAEGYSSGATYSLSGGFLPLSEADLTSTANICEADGNTNVGLLNFNFLPGGAYASRYYLTKGQVQQISLYVITASAGLLQVAIYSDLAGNPGNILFAGLEQNIVNGWNTMTADYNIPEAGYYWLAFQFSASNMDVAYDSVGVPANSENTISTGVFPSWPGSWGLGTSNSASFSMYAQICNVVSPTMTPTSTNTQLATATSTNTDTYTQTVTATVTQTVTVTITGTCTQTVTLSVTATVTKTVTATSTRSVTRTVTTTVTPTITRSVTQTATHTITETQTPTTTETVTGTYTSSPTATGTGTSTDTLTITQTDTATQSITPTFSVTSSPSITATNTGTPTFTISATGTCTPSVTQTPTSTGTNTPPPSQTFTQTITQTYTVTPTFTATPGPNISTALDRNYVEPDKGEKVKIKIKDRAIGTEVSIKIFNLSGEMIKKIGFTVLNTGWNETQWDVKNDLGNTVGRGMYFIVIKTGNKSETRKIFVVK